MLVPSGGFLLPLLRKRAIAMPPAEKATAAKMSANKEPDPIEFLFTNFKSFHPKMH
jgi:hypothetical protein